MDFNFVPMVAALVGDIIQAPAFQGVMVAAATEAIKRGPVGPSGGPGIRLVAAVLALASTLAAGAASGSLGHLDAALVGQQLLDALGAFAAATGVWHSLFRKDEAK